MIIAISLRQKKSCDITTDRGLLLTKSVNLLSRRTDQTCSGDITAIAR